MSQQATTQMKFDTAVTLKPFRWIQSKSALLLTVREADAGLVPGQLCVIDFENVQLLADHMSLDVVDFTNYRLDHLPVTRTRACVNSEMKIDAVALAKSERNSEFSKVCGDIPDEMAILHIFLDPAMWREKGPVLPTLSRK